VKIHLCECKGVDGRTGCEEPMTQEDLLCNLCRENCNPVAIKKAQEVYAQTRSLLAAATAYDDAMESLRK
jgi:hypothetical protein